MNAIEVNGLTKIYPGGIRALQGISFEVAAGEIFALLGPNGAGKTTTVRILATLAKPSGGTALVVGFDVTHQARQVRRRIGYVAQSSGLDPIATGRENLILHGQLFDLPSRQLYPRVEELLELFQLTEAADRLVQTYSWGMRRRLELARCLVHAPQILFLDEPTTGLDPESRNIVWSHLKELSTGQGVTILLTTHNMEEADRLARRIAIIDRGRVIAAGAPQELKASLGYDFVEVRFADERQASAGESVLRRLEGISKVLVDGATIFARVADGASAIQLIMRATESAGLSVMQASLTHPSLEEVYLSLTGRKYQVAPTYRSFS